MYEIALLQLHHCCISEHKHMRLFLKSFVAETCCISWWLAALFFSVVPRVFERCSFHGASARPVFHGDQGCPETCWGQSRGGLWGYHGTRLNSRWNISEWWIVSCGYGFHLARCCLLPVVVFKAMGRTQRARPVSMLVSPTLSQPGAVRWCVAPGWRPCVWALSPSWLGNPP